jgi:hypothetical protein
MVPVVAEGRGESLRPDHNNRPRSRRRSDLFFWNLEEQESVKRHHPAALLLVGWCLGIVLGITVPKDCANCEVMLENEAKSVLEHKQQIPSAAERKKQTYCEQLGCAAGGLKAISCVKEFKTEAQCKQAAEKYLHDFYTNAQKNGEMVAVSPAPACGYRPFQN